MFIAVGAGNGEYLFAVGKSNHVQKFRVDIRLALKIENEVKQLPVQLLNGFTKKVLLQIPGIAAKRTEPTGAFRTAQIAGRGGFNADCDRQTPLYGSAGPF